MVVVLQRWSITVYLPAVSKLIFNLESQGIKCQAVVVIKCPHGGALQSSGSVMQTGVTMSVVRGA